MRIAAGVLLLLATSSLWGQAKAPAKPCAGSEYRQLDFWVGDWDLSWPGPNGQPGLHGHNVITRELDDCVIYEHFSDMAQPPFQGASLSTYSAKLGKWQQTWVDNQGSYLDFVGEFKDGQMILSREFIQGGKKIRQRMVFKNIKPDSLDWSWESSDDDGATWKVVWPIHYARKKA